jgi:Glucosyl transferase GtrII/Dolichyl-phosphate-mannose-protein mannosyltransferase
MTAVSLVAEPGPLRQVPEPDPEPGRDRAAWLVGWIAAVLAIGTTAYYLHQNIILGTTDSYRHLEISRRILAGRSTGIAQLGGIWLPLPHIMQSLFAWNWTLYRTGLAGSIVSMSCYVGCSVLIYKIVRIMTGQRGWPAFVAALIFMTNADVLYQQTTSMEELPTYAFTLGAVYGLLHWSKSRKPTHVLTAGVCSLAAMLCRYEAWFLGVMYVLCVILMARRLGYSWRDTRGLALVMALFGAASAAGGWLVYNWVIFGNPLYFLDAPGSSVDEVVHGGFEPEIGNWPLTLRAYGTAVVSDLGLLVVGLGALGLVVFLIRERLSNKALPVLALTMVIPFFLWTLESGHEPFGTPTINGGLTNFRFGLIVLLPAVILIGYLLDALPEAAVVPAAVSVLSVMVVLAVVTFGTHQVALVTEAQQNVAAQEPEAEAGAFLQTFTTGPILIDTVGNERVAFPVLDRTVYLGTRDNQVNIYARALADPRSEGIDVIVMRTTPGDTDQVYANLFARPGLARYQMVYQNADYSVYVLG